MIEIELPDRVHPYVYYDCELAAGSKLVNLQKYIRFIQGKEDSQKREVLTIDIETWLRYLDKQPFWILEEKKTYESMIDRGIEFSVHVNRVTIRHPLESLRVVILREFILPESVKPIRSIMYDPELKNPSKRIVIRKTCK
ncbi:hypothetical protein DW779_02305 [Clostridium sp. AM30-24]|nr:hypothetical protein [Clostridium sp. AM30-24]RHT44809.1 hypothetical protein DW779_02305 [Clostridium sp. AM30-24]